MDDKYNYNETEGGQQEVNFVLQETPEPENVETSHMENMEFAQQMNEAKHEEAPRYQTSQPNPNPPKQVKRKPPKKKHTGMMKVAVCVGLAILFGVVASATYQTSNYIADRLLGKNVSVKNESTQTSTTHVNKSKSEITSDVTEIVKEAMPSVVSITNISVQQVQNFFGGIYEQETPSSGSGFIIGKNDSELLIATNNHVIENSKSLTVSFVDNESVEGVVRGTDPTRDVAIVSVPLKSIQSSTLKQISVATVGDSTALQVGEPAIAIGNALGYGQSVTTGIISATERRLDGFEGNLIQTDAAINPGNSGGALLNANGEVIGINTLKINDQKVEGIGYAIPMSDISELLENLMNKETRTKVPEAARGYLGISGLDVTEESAQMYSMPQGVFISEVVEGSGAEKAGLFKGNIITKFEGIGIKTMESLQTQLQYYRVGETVKVTVQVPAEQGEYEEKTVEVKLMKKF